MTMRRLLPPLLLVLALLWPVPAPAEHLSGTIDQRSRQQVTALFGAARSSLATGDGAGALALASRASLSRLEAIRNAAGLGSAAPLNGFSPSEKLGVLGLRRHFTPADLRRLRTPELVNRLLGSRWMKPETVRGAELGPLVLAGSRASAPVLIDGQPSLARAEFVREGGQWRFDLTRIATNTDTVLRVLISFSGQSEEVYLGHMLDHLHR